MNIAVIGLGLIGGSLIRALAARGHRVLGFDADPAVRATARDAAARMPATGRWQVTATIRDVAADADLVVLAVPLPALHNVLDALVASGFHGLITDVTSVKGQVRDAVATRLTGAANPVAGFVGGHPMAGREASGFASGDAALFTGCAWVLCLDEGVGLDDWLTVAELITELGARVVPATTEEHDRAVAAISHVPHLMASALAANAAEDLLALTLAAGSFRDGTRVAATRPELVAAMCGGNAEAVKLALAHVIQRLDGAMQALEERDPVKAVRAWAAEGHATRGAWPPDPGRPEEVPAHVETLLRLGRAGGWVTTVAPDRRTVTGFLPVSNA
ncbi:prephenate dehydrogenase [Rhizocola hellebori]|uniref:Prephenate dehydrogenase n=1 Tax=Rhizocola hellebori TaxID=1392758 RepID=A0A8J3QHR4_9ACTN|nr:prephenate dehydrogenase/arogenate dehydrogenase family protein [Rhizocola hellebori]GIH09847.1 prephenate dehydrogenase [Rhizocola hellebori]